MEQAGMKNKFKTYNRKDMDEMLKNIKKEDNEKKEKEKANTEANADPDEL
jgi:hypothetical protein